MPNEPTDPSKLSYEEARDELVKIVASLEAGTASLDESLDLWERGEALAQQCGQWLDRAQDRLDGKKATTTDAPAETEKTDTPKATTESSGGARPKPDAPKAPVQDDPFGDLPTEPSPPPPPVGEKPGLRSVPGTPPPSTGPGAPKPTDPPW